jgi:LysM repeat protein
MVRKIFCLLLIFINGFAKVNAQKLTPQQYVETYKDLAIKEMKRMGVPAAITLAQGLLETESGNSALVKKSNNHFGIKCKSSWTAETVTHDDDAVGECFRSYKDAEASFRDHSNYLRGTERYAFLFTLQPTDYKGWAKGLRKAGYATNPKYPEILIRNIEQYDLEQYTVEGMKEEAETTATNNKFDKETPVEKTKDKNTQPSDDDNEENISATDESINFINGHKYVNAEKGTSLLAIASANDIDLSKLLAYNDMEDDGILKKDQIIFIEKKSKTGKADFYIVQQQEPVYDIAQKNGIQLKYLLKYNDLNENSLVAAGTKLKLNPDASNEQSVAIMETTPAAVSKPPATSNKIHAVQPKEGLYSIAKNYQVSVQQLREWNNLATDDLKIGQQLIVSK